MIFEIPKQEILLLLKHQLKNFFLLTEQDERELEEEYDIVISKCEENFKHSPIRYYFKVINGIKEAYFSPFHTGQWTVFLYYYSRRIFEIGGGDLKDKLFYLNKIMNGCDIFYDVELPPHFTPSHQIGTVLGRAKYGDGLYFLHNCTVGENHGDWPVIGKNCYMCAGSSIIGKSFIGDDVTIGAGCVVKNETIPSNVMVFGQSPNLIIKKKK